MNEALAAGIVGGYAMLVLALTVHRAWSRIKEAWRNAR